MPRFLVSDEGLALLEPVLLRAGDGEGAVRSGEVGSDARLVLPSSPRTSPPASYSPHQHRHPVQISKSALTNTSSKA